MNKTWTRRQIDLLTHTKFQEANRPRQSKGNTSDQYTQYELLHRGNPPVAGEQTNIDISMGEFNIQVMPAAGCPMERCEDAKEILKVVGLAELTAANASLFRKQIRATLNGHAIIEIDLSRTISMDCAGLGTLIAIRNLIRHQNGAVRLVNPTSSVLQLLDLMRAEQVFEINGRQLDSERPPVKGSPGSKFELETRSSRFEKDYQSASKTSSLPGGLADSTYPQCSHPRKRKPRSARFLTKNLLKQGGNTPRLTP